MKSLFSSDDYKEKVRKGTTKSYDETARRTRSDRMKEQWRDEEYRRHMSTQSKKLWLDEDYRQKQSNARSTDEYRDRYNSDAHRQLVSRISKEAWSDAEHKKKMVALLKARWQDEEYAEMMHRIFASSQYRQKMSELSRQMWSDPEFRQRMDHRCYENDEWKRKIAVARSAQSSRVSNIQTVLYSILDDLGVKYYREYDDRSSDPETVIGPYNFDCIVPRDNKPDLIIECQGDYWHSLDRAIRLDKSKASYVKNLPEYELKYLWEHEFSCLEKVAGTVKYWLGISKLELIDFDFGEVDICRCPAKDYKLLLSKYHYLPNAGRGGVCWGAYLGGELIAVCIFSPLARQNIKIKQYAYDETVELSRLCIHPRYQKKNFASWFVSKCVNLLSPSVRCVISYCDTTFNHNGATYKACNFKLDGEVSPDYWYVSGDGWVMHKKTLYNRAVAMSMTESQFADRHGYRKIFGDKKLRFVLER
jgi:hypothetical protein